MKWNKFRPIVPSLQRICSGVIAETASFRNKRERPSYNLPFCSFIRVSLSCSENWFAWKLSSTFIIASHLFESSGKLIYHLLKYCRFFESARKPVNMYFIIPSTRIAKTARNNVNFLEYCFIIDLILPSITIFNCLSTFFFIHMYTVSVFWQRNDQMQLENHWLNFQKSSLNK